MSGDCFEISPVTMVTSKICYVVALNKTVTMVTIRLKCVFVVEKLAAYNQTDGCQSWSCQFKNRQISLSRVTVKAAACQKHSSQFKKTNGIGIVVKIYHLFVMIETILKVTNSDWLSIVTYWCIKNFFPAWFFLHILRNLQCMWR